MNGTSAALNGTDLRQSNPTGAVRTFPADGPWTDSGDALALDGGECQSCRKRCFPAAAVCSGCGRVGPQDRVRLASQGTLYSFSEVHVGPPAFRRPYMVGYIDLDDGVRVFGQIDEDGTELAVDARVRTVLGVIRTDPDGTDVWSYRFRRVQA